MGRKLELTTNGNRLSYKFYPNKTGYIEFWVQAERDVHIVLSQASQTRDEDPNTYLIVIGAKNNTKTFIRRGNSTNTDGVQVKDTTSIVSDKEFKGFWARWRGGVVSIGFDKVKEPFLSYADKEIMPVKFVGISTDGVKGLWKFSANATLPHYLLLPSTLLDKKPMPIRTVQPPEKEPNMKQYDIPLGMSQLDVEGMLDEHFVFYLGIARIRMGQVSDADIQKKCMIWLQKLCQDKAASLNRKRCRNIYLAQLLLCMSNDRLEGPFLLPVDNVDLDNAFTIFEPYCSNVVPDWLNESEFTASSKKENKKRGRTYVATRVLPEGQGCCAYIAISMGDEEPKWLGGGEGGLDVKLEEGYKKYVPPLCEMEKILARRRDPAERVKVLAYYDTLMQNIADELEEQIEGDENETINGLVQELIQDLQEKGTYHVYEDKSPEEQRKDLLHLLYQRIYVRKSKISKREEMLDEIEDIVKNNALFDYSEMLPEDKYELPRDMWAQVINKLPLKKVMDKLGQAYPNCVVSRFVALLSNLKEEMAATIHRRHESMISEMKRELRKEGEAAKKICDQTTTACNYAVQVLNECREAYKKQQDVEKRNRELIKAPPSEQSKIYEEMRDALKLTQKCVEEEADRGRSLAEQINAVRNQTDTIVKVNEDSIIKTEETNYEIMKNVKKMRKTIELYENKISQMKNIAKSAGSSKQDTFFM